MGGCFLATYSHVYYYFNVYAFFKKYPCINVSFFQCADLHICQFSPNYRPFKHLDPSAILL